MSARLWLKMGAAGALMCIGGPALVMWVSPTEEELFKRYNPELQKRSLENRQQKQEDFDNFVTKLKEYSKSDKPIWEVAAEAEAQAKENALARQKLQAAKAREREAEIRKQALAD